MTEKEIKKEFLNLNKCIDELLNHYNHKGNTATGWELIEINIIINKLQTLDKWARQ